MKKSISQKLKQQLILFLARRLPPCKVLLPLFSEERERLLTTREKIIKKLHLFTCGACRRYVEQIEQMSEILKPQPEETSIVELNIKLSNDARNRIKATLVAAVHNKN